MSKSQSKYLVLVAALAVLISAGFVVGAETQIHKRVKETLGENSDSFWISTHFVLWLFIGILAPHNYALFSTLNIAWELFEFLYSYRNKWFAEPTKKMYDVVFGLLGYILGSVISKHCKYI